MRANLSDIPYRNCTLGVLWSPLRPYEISLTLETRTYLDNKAVLLMENCTLPMVFLKMLKIGYNFWFSSTAACITLNLPCNYCNFLSSIQFTLVHLEIQFVLVSSLSPKLQRKVLGFKISNHLFYFEEILIQMAEIASKQLKFSAF